MVRLDEGPTDRLRLDPFEEVEEEGFWVAPDREEVGAVATCPVEAEARAGDGRRLARGAIGRTPSTR